MNAGFSSLAKLKAQLLPPAMRARTDFDGPLQQQGIGVALMMQAYCDRLFTRVTGDVCRCAANQLTLSLPRYPVEEVTSITLQTDVAELITEDIRSIDLLAGLVHFDSPPSSRSTDQLVIVYSGGYWWDTSEDDSGSLPTGATPLPDDLQMAFFLQVSHVVRCAGTLGVGAAMPDATKAKPADLGELGLVPAVQQVLNQYRRFA